MDNLKVYPRLNVNDERFQFLSSVWSDTFNGDQLHPNYVSNEPRNVLKCKNLSVKIPFKKKSYFSFKKATKFLKVSNYDRFQGPNERILLNKGSKISGEVSLNGRPMTADIAQGLVAFLPQKDLAIGSLTVDEHLRFTASLRFWKEPTNVRTERINDLLLVMNLERCRNLELRCLSGGERRRVAIATQMVARPAVLLLDEPLTGLDAAVADTIIAGLARIGQPTPTSPHGCVVVCVLHQPRPQTLRFVSRVMLIADGRVAFNGTPDETEQFYYRVNPTTETKYGAWNAILESFMVSLHSPEKADYIVNTYQNDVRYKSSVLDSGSVMTEVHAPMPPPIIRAPWSTQMKWLLWRETKNDLKFFDLTSFLFMMAAIIIGLWYAKSNERNRAGIQTATGLLFMVTSEIIYTNAYSVMLTFTPQVPVLLREKGLYGPSAYYVSRLLSLLPGAALKTALFATIVHISGNLGGDGGIKIFLPICGILVLVGIAATSYGCMLAGMANSVERAYVIAQPLDLIANSLGGIFGFASHNTFHLSWLKFISSFFYSFECTSILYWSSVKYFDCADDNSPCPTSQSVLAQTRFAAENLPRDLIALFIYIIVCNTVGFLGIWIRFQKHTVY